VNEKAELMLKIRAKAICFRCKVNIIIFVVFNVVSGQKGQNANTVIVHKSHHTPTVARRYLTAIAAALSKARK